jgi:hypothetical protein
MFSHFSLSTMLSAFINNEHRYIYSLFIIINNIDIGFDNEFITD